MENHFFIYRNFLLFHNLRELERLLEADKNSKPVFYNWLEEG